MLGKRKRNIEGGLQTPLNLIKEFNRPLITLLMLLFSMLAFKIASDAGYLWLAVNTPQNFRYDFSITKYILGWVSCLAIFFSIRHERRAASTFFLYLVFLFQIIPITSVYAFANESTTYYLTLIVAYLLCSLIVGLTHSDSKIKRNSSLSSITLFACGGAALLIIGLLFLRFGTPSLTALDFTKVYDIRGSGSFKLNKYENYLFSWTTAVILPAAMAYFIYKKKYIATGIICAIMLVLYLYCANKTILFAIPFVVVCTFWAKRKNFYKELFTFGSFVFLLLVFLLWFSPVFEDLIQRVFSLLGRRVMFVPANNKFLYFDYFSNNPKMGLGGIFPRWLLYIPNYYENIPYSYEISAIYYGRPEMNSNTGFLAEGFMRFGHIGTVLIMMLFAGILKLIDSFQERLDFQLAIGVFVYQIYSLTDAHLIDSLVLGPWMLLLILLLFVKFRDKKQLIFKKRRL